MVAPLPLSAQPVRVAALWCPNWSIEAVSRSLGNKTPELLALIHAGRVVAVSDAAAHEAVGVGLKLREAQVRCPDLTVLAHDPDLDERAFAPVLRAIERIVPHVHVIRPGLAAVRIAGAARFYGDEDTVVELLLDQCADLGLEDLRVAVADGLFCAEQASYATSAARPVINLPSSRTQRFLSTLPVQTVAAAVDQPELADLLQRMGIRHLAALAKLPRDQVHTRFGAAGLRAHLLASGHDAPLLGSASVPTDHSARVVCDPPLRNTAPILELTRSACGDLTRRLQRSGHVCHTIRVEITTEAGAVHERQWRNAWAFNTVEMLERVRWQLDDFHQEQSHQHDAVRTVTISAHDPSPAGAHAQGLWGERPDEHILHTITALQHELGHTGVRSAALVGGRLLHERQVLTAWGDVPQRKDPRDLPWPGTVPGPAPATVFEHAQPARVFSQDGKPVLIDRRGNLSGAPHSWGPAHDRSTRRRITSWNGPWPVHQRWWQKPLHINRFQIVDEALSAWLLMTSAGAWWIEACYD